MLVGALLVICVFLVTKPTLACCRNSLLLFFATRCLRFLLVATGRGAQRVSSQAVPLYGAGFGLAGSGSFFAYLILSFPRLAPAVSVMSCMTLSHRFYPVK